MFDTMTRAQDEADMPEDDTISGEERRLAFGLALEASLGICWMVSDSVVRNESYASRESRF